MLRWQTIRPAGKDDRDLLASKASRNVPVRRGIPGGAGPTARAANHSNRASPARKANAASPDRRESPGRKANKVRVANQDRPAGFLRSIRCCRGCM